MNQGVYKEDKEIISVKIYYQEADFVLGSHIIYKASIFQDDNQQASEIFLGVVSDKRRRVRCWGYPQMWDLKQKLDPCVTLQHHVWWHRLIPTRGVVPAKSDVVSPWDGSVPV